MDSSDTTARHRPDPVSADRGRWLEGILASLTDGVIAVDTLGMVSFVNAAAERLTGWRHADAAGRPVNSVLWLVEEPSRRRLEHPTPEAVQAAVVIARDGSETAVDVTTAVAHDATGGVVGTIVTLHDVSEARRAGHVEGRLAAIVDSSSDAIVSKTLAGVVTSWNAAAERIFGYSAAEMVGRPIVVIIPPERLPEEADFLARLSRGERIDHFETVRVRKDGQRIDISVTLSPIVDRHGRIVGVSKIARDITERARLERDRADLLRREQIALQASLDSNRVKDEFVATLSHELRTPINAILGWAHLLAGGAVPPEQLDKAIQVIKRNAEFQTRLIDDLLDLSSITLGRIKLDVRAVDLSAVVEAAVDALRPSARMKQLELRVEFTPGETPIMADAQRLQQVVWNLLANALRFTPAGGRIDVTVTRHARVARLVVADTGAGIPPDLVPAVFDRFRQGDSSMSRRHGGLGLGLAIVRHLVELHGGTVWCESDGPGRGARFIIELLLLREHVHGIPALAADGRFATTDGRPLPGVRALVVEDDPDGRELLTQVLALAGAEVRATESAAGALALLERERFDVILADLGMPEVDGLQLLRTVRGRGDRTPAIAVSAFVGENDRERALQAGFVRHLAKPVVADDLLRVIAALVGETREPADPSHTA